MEFLKNKKIILILGIILGMILLALFVFEISSQRSARLETFVIRRGENILQIAANLKTYGYINSKIVFIWEVLRSGKRSELKAGTYTLEANISEDDLINELCQGHPIPMTITILPGSTIKDVAALLERKGIVDKSDFLNLVMPSELGVPASKDLVIKYEFLSDRSESAGLEGYLFPDTYLIAQYSGVERIIAQILDNFRAKVSSELEKDIKKQGRSIFDTIVMASILEKEVKTLKDKQIVAGILWKRLDDGIPLEVDSTLLYFLSSDHPNTNDKNVNSLYNTYKYGGLPVGPICNPSLESIEAATTPEKSDYWFYLSAINGETIFSKTLGEHLINKAKYIK
ncbi:MAG: endolytic transglycosylase MltG [Candidatus Paceibacterota bacterium]|jgi:UPF0755 protein